MESHYIPDGHTDTAFIKGVPNVFPDTSITYRPMLHEDRMALDAAIIKGDPRQKSQAIIGQICSFVLSWDCVKPDGKTVELVPDEVRRLRNALIERIYDIILGWSGGDVKPNSKIVKSDSEAELEAILKGTPENIVREGNDIKNSSAALPAS